MDELARRDPDHRTVVRAAWWFERLARPLARGVRAALALILFVVAELAQVPTAEELWTELADDFAAGRHEQVVARWQAVGSQVEASQDLWPYAVLTAGESMLRLGLWQDTQLVLADLHSKWPQPPPNIECHRLAMVGRLNLIEGRSDLAREPIRKALELSMLVRELGEWAWPTVSYAHLRAVELAHALEQHDEVERLVESFRADEELYATDPVLKAELLLACGAAQEQREIDAPLERPRARATLLRVAEELAAVSPSVERDRVLVHVELALGRIELAAGDLESSGGRLAAAGRLLADSGQGGALNERTLLATFEAQHALARGANDDVLERVRADLLSAYEGRYARLASLPLRPGGLGLLHNVEIRAPLVLLARLDVALDGKAIGGAKSLTRMLKVQALGSLARAANAPVPTVAEVQALLEENSGLLLYLPSARSSVVIVVERDRVVCEETAGLNSLQRTLSEYRGILLAGLSDDSTQRRSELEDEREFAAQLATLLWPDDVVERVKTWRAVTVSGLDVLGPVPLGWLPLDDVSHLGCAVAWDTMPSIPFGVAQARELVIPRPEPHAELLLVGGVRPSEKVLSKEPGLETLHLSERVESALAGSYSAHSTLTVDQATVSHVLDECAQHAVVQMLVHAIEDPSRTPPMGLVLEGVGEDPGVLWADTVRSGQFAGCATRLMVLAACRSAQGRLRRGDAGSTDLAGACLAAGVPAVLVSHSDLTWGPMVELSEAFHLHLRDEGCSPAEALRRAISEQDVSDARELPFRYGLLEVVGLGQRAIFEPPAGNAEGIRSNAPVLVLCGVLLIAVTLAARRTRRTA